MGFADKAKSGGGQSVEGVVTGSGFTNKYPFGDNDSTDNIYWTVEVTAEGAEDPSLRAYYLGSSKFLIVCDEDGEPVEDGETGAMLKSGEDGEVDEEGFPKLYDKGEAYRIISQLEEAGFPAEEKFPDPSEEHVLDFRGLIGWRVRLGQEQDVEGQLAAGKKALGAKANGKSQDEILEAGKRKAKKGKHKGKFFNLTRDTVVKVFSPDEAPAKSSKKAKDDEAPAKGKKTAKEDTKGKKKAAKDEDDGPSADAVLEFLIGTVNAQPKKTADKGSLHLLTTRYAAKIKMDNAERDALRAAILKDDFAFVEEQVEAGTLAMTKKGVISIPEDDEDEDDDE